MVSGLPRARRLARGALAAIALSLAAAACGGSGTTATLTSPSAVPKCAVTIDAAGGTVPAEGGSGTIAVTTARECAWSVESQNGWLTIKAGGSGQGDGTVEYAAAPNPDPVSRRGGIVVNSARAEITQGAGACAMSLSANSAAFPPSGGSGRVDVRASSSMCTWNSAASDSWITIRSGASGTGNGSVAFDVAPTSGPPRSAVLTIAGQRFEVTESQGCDFTIAPAAFSAPAAGGSGTVAVTTTAGCPWSAGSNVDWVAITSGATGTGPGSAAFVVAPTTGVTRTGTLVVAGQTLTVTQSQGCQYDVAPAAHTIAAGGGSANVAVATAPGCAWTAASNVPWIQIDSSPSGAGSASVRFTAQPTSGPARGGTLTIAGRTVSVTQSQGCSYAVTPENPTVAASGGSVQVAVSAGAACAWTAASAVPWIAIASGASGSGDGTVQLTVAATSGPGRSGAVTVAGRTVTVAQGQGCSLALSATSANVAAAGGEGSFGVQAGDGCAWTATTTAPWLSITAGQSGSGAATVRFTAAANPGAARSGTIAVGGQTFTVTQAGGCTATLSASSATVPSAGGSGSVGVTTNATCTWSSSSDANWLTITSGQSGAGNGTVGFTAAANSGPSRSGTLTIAGRPFTVTQSVGCSFSISPDQQNVNADGGSVTIAVTSPGGCGWTATSNAPWITIANGGSGSGNGSVRLQVAANGGAARSGTATIAGRTFTVNQGLACSFAIAPEQRTVDAGNDNVAVAVTTPAGCGWTATANVPWLSVSSGTSGTGIGIVRLQVAANFGAARSGTATIAGRTFTVNQGQSCSFSIAPEQQAVDAAGGAATVAIAAPGGCAWSAAANVPWIAINGPAGGSGNGSVALAIAANTGSPRSGTVTIAGRTFTVNQAGGCSFVLNPLQQAVPAAGGSGTIAIAASAPGCEWTASSNAPWITLTSPAAGSGSGSVQFAVAANADAARAGTIVIAGQTFAVTQDGGCSFAATPGAMTAPAAGGAGRIDVATAPGCAWSASATVPWISVTAGASGTGNGSVEIAIGANNGPDRSGGVRIGTQTVIVNQSSGCTFTLGATSQTVPDTGGPGSVTVTTTDGCAWTAVSQVPWIAVTSGGSGSGSGTVQFAIEPRSSGGPRTGTIVIAGQTFTVNQS